LELLNERLVLFLYLSLSFSSCTSLYERNVKKKQKKKQKKRKRGMEKRMEKRRSNFSFLSLIVVLVCSLAFVQAQYTPYSTLTVHTPFCYETDGGVDYTTKGSNVGIFSWYDQNLEQNFTHYGAYTDFCIPETTIMTEGVCDRNMNATQPQTAWLHYVNCNTLQHPNGGCFEGRCVENMPTELKGKTYLLRAVDFRQVNGRNLTTFEYLANENWVTLANASFGTVFSIGPLQLFVNKIDVGARTVELFMINQGGFDRIYTKVGNYIVLDTNKLHQQLYADAIFDEYGNSRGGYRGDVSGGGNSTCELEGQSNNQEFFVDAPEETYLTLMNLELETESLDLPFMYVDPTTCVIGGFGRNSTRQLATSREIFSGAYVKMLSYHQDTDEYFIASWYPEVIQNSTSSLTLFDIKQTQSNPLDAVKKVIQKEEVPKAKTGPRAVTAFKGKRIVENF